MRYACIRALTHGRQSTPTSTTSRCPRQHKFRHRCGSLLRSGSAALPAQRPTAAHEATNRQEIHLSKAKRCLGHLSMPWSLSGAGASLHGPGAGRRVSTRRGRRNLCEDPGGDGCICTRLWIARARPRTFVSVPGAKWPRRRRSSARPLGVTDWFREPSPWTITQRHTTLCAR
jgi:hypothetical protein